MKEFYVVVSYRHTIEAEDKVDALKKYALDKWLLGSIVKDISVVEKEDK